MPDPIPQRELYEEERGGDGVNSDAINSWVRIKTESTADQIWTQLVSHLLKNHRGFIQSKQIKKEVTGLWLSYLNLIQTNQFF